MSTTAVYSEPVTRRQLDYINDLLDGRQVENVPQLKEQAKKLTKRTASQWIEKLKTLPKRHPAMVPERGSTPSISSRGGMHLDGPIPD